MPNFVKISALDEKNKKYIKDFWTPLWGDKYTKAIVKDYTSEISKKKKE